MCTVWYTGTLCTGTQVHWRSLASLMKSWCGQCGQTPDTHCFFPLRCIELLAWDSAPEWCAGYLYQGVTVDAPCPPRQLLTEIHSGAHMSPQPASIGRDTDSNGSSELTSSPHPEYQSSLGTWERAVWKSTLHKHSFNVLKYLLSISYFSSRRERELPPRL